MAVMPVVHALNYGSADTSRLRSPNVWRGFNSAAVLAGEIDGFYHKDDFTSGGLITSPTTEAALIGVPYSGFGSSGAVIRHGDAQFGTIELEEATDNEAVYMKAETHPFKISANLGLACLEARLKVSAITDDQIGFIFGLFDTTAMTVIVPLSTANPPIFATTGNFVGFWGREQDAGAVRSTYVADGVTAVTVEAAVHQFVADTYVKLALRFDPKDNYLRFYVNNIEEAEKKLIPDDTGTDFPADVRLAPFLGMRLGGSTTSTLTMDWWEYGQLGV